MFVLGNTCLSCEMHMRNSYICLSWEIHMFVLGNDRNENLKSSGYCPVFAFSATLTVGHKFCTLIYIQ